MSINSENTTSQKKTLISRFRKPKSPTVDKPPSLKPDEEGGGGKKKFFDKRRAKSIDPGSQAYSQAKEYSKNYARHLSIEQNGVVQNGGQESNGGHIGPEEFVSMVRERRNSDVGPHLKLMPPLAVSTFQKASTHENNSQEEPTDSVATPSITVSDFDHENILSVSQISRRHLESDDNTSSPNIRVYSRVRSEPMKPSRSGLFAAVKNMVGRRASINPPQNLSTSPQGYRTSRRFSQPEVASLHSFGELHQRRISGQLEDTFTNFPQVTSNNSASRELSRFCPPSGHYIIWKEKNKIERIIRISNSNNGEDNAYDISKEPQSDDIFKNLLETKTIYDAMLPASRLVTIDINIQVKSVFYVFNFERIKSAPLWDGVNSEFKGMLTVTDLIDILLNFAKGNFIDELSTIETDSVCKWRDILLEGRKSDLISLKSSDRLINAFMALRNANIHRLLVTNTEGEALYILTKRKILHYLYKTCSLYMMPQSASFMSKSIKDLELGTYENIASAKVDTPLKDVLRLLFDRRISSLPILDQNNRVINIYQKADVMHLILLDIINLMNVPVGEILKQERLIFEGVYSCKETASFGCVLDIIIKLDVHRLMVVDENDVFVGIISISDILQFLARSSTSEREGKHE